MDGNFLIGFFHFITHNHKFIMFHKENSIKMQPSLDNEFLYQNNEIWQSFCQLRIKETTNPKFLPQNYQYNQSLKYRILLLIYYLKLDF